jgi:hypothetical protein
VQPTDQVSGRFSCSEGERGDREEDERGSREHDQDLGMMMKAQILRLSITLMAIAATALAGGATIKVF